MASFCRNPVFTLNASADYDFSRPWPNGIVGEGFVTSEFDVFDTLVNLQMRIYIC
jgi:hypothetical protein